MNPNEKTIFDAALQITDVKTRAAYLDQVCSGDQVLRQRIENLLRASQRADEFLADDPLDLNETKGLMPPIEGPGTIIGQYKLLEKLGEGGFGVVYMAEQKQPIKRRVALKIVKVGMDTREVVARFEAERQALALMDHPNIAKVFDAGGTESPHPASGHPLPSDGRGAGGEGILRAGRPYFVMELVRGIKITDYCDEKNLSTRERLDLFAQVCQAVQHAHQKGIIHRDLKPSNILVTINDGSAVPKIIDFGIAKATQMELTEKTVFTRFHQFLGTPAYMSPEQTELTSVDIDTRSDIYSLGVLLYELLTGQTPFDTRELVKAGLDEMRRTIREEEPQRPSTRVSTLRGDELTITAKRRGLDVPRFVNTLRGDLDWIVMKCLEKDRARRYETANGLASDIQRHLNNEPVMACPPSAAYRFQKLVRRNKVVFAAATGVAAALVIGFAFALWQSIEKTRAYSLAVAAEKEAKTARAQAETNERRARVSEREAQTEAAKSAQVAQFLKSILKSVTPSIAMGRDTTLLRQVLDDAARGLERGLTNQPEMEMALREALAQTYSDMGLVEPMEQFTRTSVEVARSRLGADHRAYAVALVQLGEAQLAGGKLDEAERTLREAWARQEKVHGAESEEVANTIDDLGGVLWRRGNLDQAESLDRQALAIRRKLHGNEHALTAGSLNDLALVLKAEGKQAEAHAAFKEALEINWKLGPEAPIVAVNLCNFSILLQEEGDLDEAEARCREALRLDQKVNAETTDLPWILNQLGNILREQGKLNEAEAMIKDALARRRKLVGNDHPDVAISLRALAAVFRDENRPAEAEASLREALDIFRKRFGEESRDAAKCLSGLALVLHDQGKFADAEAAQTNALAIQRKLLGGKNPEVATSVANLAALYMKQGKAQEAESLLRECLAIREELLPDHWSTFDTLSLLGANLLAQKRYPEAETLLISGYEGLRRREHRMPFASKPRLKEALLCLVQFYEETARLDQAVEWRRKLTE